MLKEGEKAGKSVRGLAERRYLIRLLMGIFTFLLVIAALHMEVILQSLGVKLLLVGEIIVFLIVVVGIDLDCRLGLIEMEELSKLELDEAIGPRGGEHREEV